MAGTKRSREGEPLINIKPDSNSNTVTTNSNNPVEQKEENASTTTTTTMAVAADVAMTDTDTADTTMAEMAEPSSSDSQQRQIQLIFETFRDELDEHYDRRERIVKATRDITALSKKIIFSLQRLRTIAAPIPASIAKENKVRTEQILELFRSLIPDISTGPNAWRYQRQLSPGVQEFVEALSFQHYVQTQRLISLEEVRAALPPEVLVTEEDYLMGLFDLTGEMMRFAVTVLSSGGQVKRPVATKSAERVSNMDGVEEAKEEVPELPPPQAGVVVDLRAMRSEFEALTVPRRHSMHMMRDLPKKMEVMQTSVEKVERAAYSILVRGSERPGGWTPDLTTPAEVETY